MRSRMRSRMRSWRSWEVAERLSQSKIKNAKTKGVFLDGDSAARGV